MLNCSEFGIIQMVTSPQTSDLSKQPMAQVSAAWGIPGVRRMHARERAETQTHAEEVQSEPPFAVRWRRVLQRRQILLHTEIKQSKRSLPPLTLYTCLSALRSMLSCEGHITNFHGKPGS